jgi:hypothetical protein
VELADADRRKERRKGVNCRNCSEVSECACSRCRGWGEESGYDAGRAEKERTGEGRRCHYIPYFLFYFLLVEDQKLLDVDERPVIS